MTESAADMSDREVLQESRKLLKRSKKRLSDSKFEEIDATINEAASARKRGDDTEFSRTADKLRVYIEGPLASARKSKSREMFESVFLAVIVALCIRAFIFELFKIPSPSMVPTLMVGDRLVVEKFSYGLRVPFSTRYLIQWDEPERGDVVVFQFPRMEARTRQTMAPLLIQLDALNGHELPGELSELEALGQAPSTLRDAWGQRFEYERTDDGYELASIGPDGEYGTADDITAEQLRATFLRRSGPLGSEAATACPIDEMSLNQRSRTYIKRVVGEPGDTIELRDNLIYINGEPQQLQDVRSTTERAHSGVMIAHYATELLDGDEPHTIRYFREERVFGPIEVPEGQYLMMGDNRDDSSDGRCWGFVPGEYVKGRATRIAFTSDDHGPFGVIKSMLNLSAFERTGEKIR